MRGAGHAVAPGQPVIAGLSHVAVAVPDLDAAIAHIVAVFGVTVGAPMVNDTQGVRLAYVELGNARIELLQPTRADSPLARFLDRNPRGGLHHISLVTGDLDAALATAGVAQAGTIGRNVHGERIAFLDPRELLGALFELEERITDASGSRG